MCSLSILAWNTNMLGSAKQTELNSFLTKHSILLAFLFETREHLSSISELLPYRQHATKDCLLLVHPSVQYSFLHTVNDGDCEAFVVDCNGIVLVGRYCRRGSIAQGILKFLHLVNLYKPNYFMGDLNARPDLSNAAGATLYEWCLAHPEWTNMNLENRHTYQRSDKTPSTLDYCFAREDSLTLSLTLTVEHELRSDHYGLMLKDSGNELLSLPSDSLRLPTPFAYNLHRSKLFASFISRLKLKLTDAPLLIDPEGNALFNFLKTGIYQALRVNIGWKKRNARRKPKPWMDQEVRSLIYCRNKSRRLGNIDYPILRKACINLIKRKKRQKFLEFAEGINYKLGPKQFWDRFTMLTSKPRAQPNLTDNIIEANRISQSFISYSVPSSPLQTAFIPPDINDGSELSYTSDFTQTEFSAAFARVPGNTRCGPDGVPYSVYQALDNDGRQLLLGTYNCWFSSGLIPAQIKQAYQVAIPKKCPGEYRPITLLNTCLKLYELLIFGRLKPLLANHIPEYQYGFQDHIGAQDQLANFISELRTKKRSNQHSVILFLDIRKAFDRVDRNLLLSDLLSINIRGRLLIAIQNCITGKVYRVLHNGVLNTSPYTTDYGVPQGSVLSPILYNFFARNAMLNAPDDCRPHAFADDLAVTASHPDLEQCHEILSACMDQLLTWAETRGIEFHTGKLRTIQCAYRSNLRQPHLRVRLRIDPDSEPITPTQTYEYLGAVIDSNLNLKPWLRAIQDNVKTRIQMVRRASKTMQVPRRTLEILYNGYVRGFLNYANAVWMPLPFFRRAIDALDLKGYRTVIGVLPHATNVSVGAEMNTSNYCSQASKHLLRVIAKRLMYPETFRCILPARYDGPATRRTPSNTA